MKYGINLVSAALIIGILSTSSLTIAATWTADCNLKKGWQFQGCLHQDGTSCNPDQCSKQFAAYSSTQPWAIAKHLPRFSSTLYIIPNQSICESQNNGKSAHIVDINSAVNTFCYNSDANPQDYIYRCHYLCQGNPFP